MTEQEWFEKLATDFPNGYFSLEVSPDDAKKILAYVGTSYLEGTFSNNVDALTAIHAQMSK